MDQQINSLDFDQVLSTYFQQQPILGALVVAGLRGSRIIITGDIGENLFNMIPDRLYFEKRDQHDFFIFEMLGEQDLLFVENFTVDELWQLASLTRAQIVHLSTHSTDASLCDFEIQEKDLRSAILGVGSAIDRLKSLASDEHFWGKKTGGALFLDRDGVVIKDTGYVQQADQVELIDGVVKLISRARQKKLKVFIFTNQSGIGRELLSEAQYDQVNARMLELLAEQAQYVDAVIKAPFYEKSARAYGYSGRSLRKPRPGMLQKLAQEYAVNLGQSVVVGDSARDLQAGALIKIPNLYLFSQKPGEAQKWKDWPLLSRAYSVCQMREIADLAEIHF